MRSARVPVTAFAFVLLAAACGGTVVSPGSSGSSGTSGESSSGTSGTSGASSGSSGTSGTSGISSSGTSGISSSGSSGTVCAEGSTGPSVCPGGCSGGLVPEVCKGGVWVCPPVPPCPPPVCDGPPPPCSCPINCICGAKCDPSTNQWTCFASCQQADAGAPFACGDRSCNYGDVCIDVAKAGGGQTGPYQCLPNPSVCSNDYSCGCEMKALASAGTCKPVSCDQTFGNVVVHCDSL